MTNSTPGVRPSTVDMIAQEAQRRGINVRLFDELYRGFYQLERSGHAELGFFSSSQGEGYVVHRIFGLKALTTVVLRQGGFPVPEEILTADVSAAIEFLRQHKKIVIKPARGTGGAGVTPGIVAEKDVPAALAGAQAASAEQGERRVVCQVHVEGRDFRILVINQRRVFAMERIPAQVVGDGVSTLRQLVAARNATLASTYHVRLDARLNLNQVIAAGERLQVAQVANAHSGGTVHDVTNMLHPDVRRMAIRVAEYFRMPVVGMDWIAPDIQKPEGLITELNSTPDLTIHHFPDTGEVQNTVGAFVDMLFPETQVN